MKLTDEFTINGHPMLVPDADVDESYEDLDGADSGRTEDGVMHRTVVRYNVGKWSFNYSSLTKEEKQYIESLFPDAPDFKFGHPNRIDPSRKDICRAYRSKHGISIRDIKNGIWKNYKFDIVEC